jgi:hypothetical protein|tara:strand:- start:325 stop:456 length:132 start_codon:yes stop_codon:yes gene_type:complete
MDNECDCKNIGLINNDWLCLECGEKVKNPNEESEDNKHETNNE